MTNSESMTLEDAVKELYWWQYNEGTSTNFHSLLYMLFQKADRGNLKKLSRGFPEEAVAFDLWCNASDYGNDLFREYGLILEG